MNRRRFLAASATVLGAGAAAMPYDAARAVPPEVRTALQRVAFESGKPVPTIDEMQARDTRGRRGTASPYPGEIAKSRQIVAQCPFKSTPFEVALFFDGLRQGSHNEALGPDTHLYAEEWPVRANPLIVQFFDATTLRTPSGDQTAWCAAFVNWCLVRARFGRSDAAELLPATSSAASETFRRWGAATNDPQPGDIVVFRHRLDAGKGHVGFFVGRAGASLLVLGGNQMPLRVPGGIYERGNTGEINIKRMPLEGADLILHSIRTDPSLHDL